MMAVLWVVLFWASVCLHAASGFPVGPTPQIYPHESDGQEYVGWGSESGLYMLPALALVLTTVGLLFGCTWCYQHKDCKPDEGTDNQIFTASATHLHDARSRSQPPDSGFSEPVNNNVGEDNNNGPISLREMQNIENNNAAVYIVSENEERNRINRESVVEFEPLPPGIRVLDPLERCADWFAGEDFPRTQLQYLREIGRGWFGRVVEGEIEDGPTSATVAVKILNPNASLEDKARFLDEARIYRDIGHENVLPFIAKCLTEDPWLLMFELCSMDLQQYLEVNRPKMAILNEGGVPLQLMCDVASGLAHLHSRGYLYGALWSGSVLVRGSETVRAVLGQYAAREPPHDCFPPETSRQPPAHTTSSEVWSLGCLLWEVCAWGAPPPLAPPPPHIPCPYRNHLYQVMQLCWNPTPESRPTAAQVHALLNHLHTTHLRTDTNDQHFEERWQRLKPNTIPKVDEHVAIVHAPSTSTDSQFGSDLEFESARTTRDSLSVGDTAVSRSSSIMSDKEPLSIQMKSESLNNLHGSFEDVRNIYLTHNEAAAQECHQGNMSLEEKEQDRSDSSVDPWLKDIITGSQDDVSYFKDVSDVIKNLDNILNSEKTSSSESSHQASPSRDNLNLECKKDYPMQTSLVKSPGIRNFQNILEMGFDSKSVENDTYEDDVDRETIGTLSHSFERHSDTTSQYTLENLTPETPIQDFTTNFYTSTSDENISLINDAKTSPRKELPNSNIENNDIEVPTLKELCEARTSLCDEMEIIKDCVLQDNDVLRNDSMKEAKSVDLIPSEGIEKLEMICVSELRKDEENTEKSRTPLLKNDTDIRADRNISPLVNKSSTVIINEHVETKNDFTRIQDVESEQDETIYTPNKDIVESHESVNKIDENLVPISSVDVDSLNFTSHDHLPHRTSVSQMELSSPNDEESVCFESDIKLVVAQNISSLPHGSNKQQPHISELNESPKLPNDLVKQQEVKVELIESIPIKDHEHLGKVNDNHINNTTDNNTCLDLEIRSESSDNAVDLVCKKIVEVNSDIETISEPLKVIENSVSKDLINKEYDEHLEITQTNLENVRIFTELPDLVQIGDSVSNITNETFESQSKSQHTPARVQTPSKENISSDSQGDEISCLEQATVRCNDLNIPTENNEVVLSEQSADSTVYMDFSDDTNEVSKIKNQIIPSSYQNNQLEIDLYNPEKNDSTVYFDLPSVIREMDVFLHAEKIFSDHVVEFKNNVHASTPMGSSSSVDNVVESSKDETLGDSVKEPDYGPGVVLTKLEQKSVPDNFSPYESPTKSHHTDTYDENSSVVLGPFENCTLELFKGLKSGCDLVDLPKEELLAFSSNFSDINLETPSPLRDSNFLNEVPDLIHDDVQFDEPSTSELKPVTDPHTDNNTDETEDQSTTEKRISPSTPPNSPGNILASSQPYLVDIDFENESIQNVGIDEMDVTQLAMAENENNMNIEYSGPLVEEGLNDVSRVNDTLPESYLAGNGGPFEETGNIAIDEERMKELRNELELKLPLAQVAGIEPASSWTELPPPPELLVTYGALSPIAEETRHQLTAYENDDNWNMSVRTESSESYPEPGNNSTDEATELRTGPAHSTCTVPSQRTYTVHRDATASKEFTMSVDSLNESPLKKATEEALSPIDDRTFNKNDEEKELNCEMISQVSPFLLSPTTDTSVPDNSDLNAALSTLSKTSAPTDAKTSKPSETQCLSKATSIDSWCSNDTLYNVEENFDDLAMDPDLPLDLEQVHERDKSESEDTLTHNEDEKELSHCSTYIVHDSKSEACETFSPDSITANDNYTYTKVKTGTTPSANTKSDLNDSTKNTQTKDLAYGTLGSGMPSFSNCTTELISGLTCDDTWKLPQPELVRRSPIGDNFQFTPPRQVEDKSDIFETPDIIDKPQLNKMDSVEITCFKEQKDVEYPKVKNESPKINFKDVTNITTSTPVTETDGDNKEVIPYPLSQIRADDSEISAISLTYFQEPSPNNSRENKSHHKEDVILDKGQQVEADKSKLTNITSGKLESCLPSETERAHKNLLNSSNKDGVDSIVSDTSFRMAQNESEKTEICDNSSKKFESFLRSAEIRPQDLSNSSHINTIGPSKDNTSSQILEIGKPEISNSSLKNFEVFISSAELRPQDLSNNKDRPNYEENIPEQISQSKVDISEVSSQNIESFIRSAEIRPQDMSNTALNSVLLAKSDISDNSLETFQSFLHSDEITTQNISPNNIDASEIKYKKQNIPSTALDVQTADSETSVNSLTNFQSFLQSAEMRPQDVTTSFKSESGMSHNVETSGRENQHISQNSYGDCLAVSKKTLTYSDFENSASFKPQDVYSMDKSCNSEESGVGSEGFRNFENSARNRPQDLLSLIDASSLLLNNERASSEHIMNSFLNKTREIPSTSRVGSEPSIIINPTFRSFRDSPNRDSEPNIFITDLDLDDENEQPHSIIITESPLLVKTNPNQTFDSHEEGDLNDYDSHSLKRDEIDEAINSIESVVNVSAKALNKSFIEDPEKEPISNERTKEDIVCNGSNEVFATVHFLNETFEELVESNVDDNDCHEANKGKENESENLANETKSPIQKEPVPQDKTHDECTDCEGRAVEVTQDFLQNEKNFCQLNAYFPLLSDIKFTGPGSEMMSTSFTQESPTEPTSPECERDSTTEKDKPSELLKEWDSDTDSHSTNSSSGEFIWKDGDGYETALVPDTQFEHQRDSGQPSRAEMGESMREASSAGSGGSGDSGSESGSEGDEVEFVPSSWDCRAAPAKSSLRSLEQPADGKKRVVFKRQKYHCVYEYPREVSDLEVDSPAHYLPDLSTYCEWDPRSAEEAEVGYGQLFGAPSPLDMFPLRAGIAFGADYDEDFFISSSARPFELGVMSTTSQFFPGMHLKQSLLPEHDDFPPPPSPLPPLDPSPLPLSQTRTPSLDFTTPDSGVEDITPGSTTDDDLKMSETWKPDSASSSESVSPSSPGGELGGLRHTRDKLKLDLPPSPHLPSPRHSRVFNFVLEKPKRPAETNTPLVMSDETPVMIALPVCKRDDPMPEPTFSTFGKPTCKSTADSRNIVLTDNSETTEDPDVMLESADILTDDVNDEVTENEEVIMKTPDIEEKSDKVEPVKGEGTVLDSGDEDSGIESSSKATLERKPASNVS